MLKRHRAGHARRLSLVVLTAALGLDAFAAWSQTRDPTADALLAIDLNRSTVIERIVMQWGGLVLPSGTVLDAGQLRQRLSSLRADRLLAASLAGTSEGVQQVLAQAAITTRRDARLKSLGDVAVDLTYTPLTPCRIIDTRYAVGPLQPGVVRTEAGYTATTFAGQGGDASNCGIPAGVAALALNVVAVNPTNLGFIKLWPSNAPQPNASTINYDPTTTNIASGTIVRVDGANNNSFDAESPAQVQMVVDVVGYFAAPSGNGGTFFKQGGNAFGTTAILGTSDNQPLNISVNGAPVVRLSPAVDVDGNAAINVINGFSSNTVDAGAIGATISGGGFKRAFDNGLIVNHIAKSFGTIGGGVANMVTGDSGTIAGGQVNTAGESATVGGGISNTASGVDAVVVGGVANTASGANSVVPGGVGNTASGNESFAAGALANADQDNCILFVYWHPGSGGGANCLGTQYQFRVEGDHGLSIDYGARIAPNGNGTRWVAISDTVPGKTIATWTNAYLADGGTWVNASDRESKTGFEGIEPLVVLAKVATMPITQWRYKSQTDELHLGPVAQDFYAAFGLGADDKHIATVDEAGVALAAIQGLHQLLQEKDARIAAQERTLTEQQRSIAEQQRQMAELGERMNQVESLRSELDVVKHALLRLTSGAADVATNGTQ